MNCFAAGVLVNEFSPSHVGQGYVPDFTLGFAVGSAFIVIEEVNLVFDDRAADPAAEEVSEQGRSFNTGSVVKEIIGCRSRYFCGTRKERHGIDSCRCGLPGIPGRRKNGLGTQWLKL